MKPIIYLYFHSKILNWKGKEIKAKEFLGSFFQWRIPKTLRQPIMKEMEVMGLIKIEKKMVYMNNYYFKETYKKKKVKDKDKDTKIENPYLPYENF